MGKGKDFKRPYLKSSSRFQVKETSPVEYDLEKPIFSLRYMPYRGPCCITQFTEEKKSVILERLLRLSQSTWRELKRLPRENGFEPIPNNRFKVPLPPILTEEVTILVVRFDGDGGRLAGFRDKDIYHVVLAGKNLYSH
jgi:hypothetical protein